MLARSGNGSLRESRLIVANSKYVHCVNSTVSSAASIEDRIVNVIFIRDNKGNVIAIKRSGNGTGST